MKWELTLKIAYKLSFQGVKKKTFNMLNSGLKMSKIMKIKINPIMFGVNKKILEAYFWGYFEVNSHFMKNLQQDCFFMRSKIFSLKINIYPKEFNWE